MERKIGVSCLGVTFQKAALGPQKAQIILETITVTRFAVHLIVQAILPLKAAPTGVVTIENSRIQDVQNVKNILSK